MIKIDESKLKLVPMGSDYDFAGNIEFDGTTVEDVIAEIKERLDKHGEFVHSDKLGDFGNKHKGSDSRWAIETDDKLLISSTHGDTAYNFDYFEEVKKKPVVKLHVLGGYWSDYTYFIYTKGDC